MISSDAVLVSELEADALMKRFTTKMERRTHNNFVAKLQSQVKTAEADFAVRAALASPSSSSTSSCSNRYSIFGGTANA